MEDFEICAKCRNDLKECIIAQKIFDQCRLQICLTPSIIGPAKAAAPGGPSCCKPSSKGESLVPPANAVSVNACNIRISDVAVLSKTPSSLNNCMWDIKARFTFRYILTFFDNDNREIYSAPAFNTYTANFSLYGGNNVCGVNSFNELYGNCDNNGPFLSIDSNAVLLAASLRYPCRNGGNSNNCCTCIPCNNGSNNNCGCGSCGNNNFNCNSICGCSNDCNCTCTCKCSCVDDCGVANQNLAPIGVNVTIGLFAVVRLARISNLCVESCGICVPEECDTVSPETSDPCAFFDSLDFPTNLFAPQSCYVPASDCGTATYEPNCGNCGGNCGNNGSCGNNNCGNNSCGNSNCGNNNYGCSNGRGCNN